MLRSLRHYLGGHKAHAIIHHRSPGRERHRKGKRQTIFLERTREGHRQSDEHWNCRKGNVGEMSEMSGAQDFPSKTIMVSVELASCTLSVSASFCVSVCLSVCFSLSVGRFLSVCRSVCWSLCLSLSLSLFPPPPLHLSPALSFCLLSGQPSTLKPPTLFPY